MSRFFRSVSDSESDSESSDNESFISDEELSSDEEEHSDEEQENQEEQPKKSRFLKGAETDSDEESDEEFGRKRQVKSALDKRLDEMNSSIKAIENGQKNNDWNLISTGTATKKIFLFVFLVFFSFYVLLSVEKKLIVNNEQIGISYDTIVFFLIIHLI